MLAISAADGIDIGFVDEIQSKVGATMPHRQWRCFDQTSQRLEREVQRELHKEGLGNMVGILKEASEASLELI